MAYVIKISNEQLTACKDANIALRKALIGVGCLVPSPRWTRVWTEARTRGYRSKLVGYDLRKPSRVHELVLATQRTYPGVKLTVQMGGRGDNGAQMWHPSFHNSNCWHIFADWTGK